MEMQSPLLPLGATARRLHVPARWLRQEAEADRVPHLKAGNQYLFNVEAVERLLLERIAAKREVCAHAG